MSERQDGGERRRLERAPGERYAARDGGPGSDAGGGRPARSRVVVVAAIVADVGALLFFALGLLDLGVGLVVVAAFTGWATALALVWWGRDVVPVVRTRVAVGAVLGGWSVILGIAIDWAYGLTQGGVLGPLDYVLQRYGPWGPASILVATLVAAWRAR